MGDQGKMATALALYLKDVLGVSSFMLPELPVEPESVTSSPEPEFRLEGEAAEGFAWIIEVSGHSVLAQPELKSLLMRMSQAMKLKNPLMYEVSPEQVMAVVKDLRDRGIRHSVWLGTGFVISGEDLGHDLRAEFGPDLLALSQNENLKRDLWGKMKKVLEERTSK